MKIAPAEQVVRHGRARSPFELGLAGWWISTRDLYRPQCTAKEKREGSRYRFVILDVEGNNPPTTVHSRQVRLHDRPRHLGRLVPDGEIHNIALASTEHALG